MTEDQWELVSRTIAFLPENQPTLADLLPQLEHFALNEESDEEFRMATRTILFN